MKSKRTGTTRKKTLPVEKYTAKRKAEFLLANAIDLQDYRAARKAVKKLGVDPDTIRSTFSS